MEETYTCKYCGKICKNKNSLAQHEIRCKENPNRIVNKCNHNSKPKNTNKWLDKLVNVGRYKN